MLPAQHRHTSSARASSEGLLRAGLSGDVAVTAPVQSVGILTPLVPLLGTAGTRGQWQGHGGLVWDLERSLLPFRPIV